MLLALKIIKICHQIFGQIIYDYVITLLKRDSKKCRYAACFEKIKLSHQIFGKIINYYVIKLLKKNGIARNVVMQLILKKIKLSH